MLHYIFVAILSLLAILEIAYYWVYMDAVNRAVYRNKKKPEPASATLPTVSVVISARNEADNLRRFLKNVLTQDYPDYEVIVVDDESQDDTRIVIEQFQNEYPHLHSTFVPHEARICSSKKLALTLAAKAAKGEYLLLTDADCIPDSKYWIREMMQKVTSGTEVVLGYGAYFEQQTLINRLIQYDTLFCALQYMGMAIMGQPYMGVGRNLAYSKEMFFRQKGFAGLLGMRSGDDDLFVNKVANKENTAVAVSKESITWSLPKTTFREWLQQKRRHLSVSPKYTSATKQRLLFEPLIRGLFYLMLIVVCLQPYWWCWTTAALCFILRYLTQVLVINRAARHFSQRRFIFAFIIFDIYLPVNNLALILFNIINRKKLQQW